VQGKKLTFARWVREIGLPLTINAVVNRHNVSRVERMIDLAVSLGLTDADVRDRRNALAARAGL